MLGCQQQELVGAESGLLGQARGAAESGPADQHRLGVILHCGAARAEHRAPEPPAAQDPSHPATVEMLVATDMHTNSPAAATAPARRLVPAPRRASALLASKLGERV